MKRTIIHYIQIEHTILKCWLHKISHFTHQLYSPPKTKKNTAERQILIPNNATATEADAATYP